MKGFSVHINNRDYSKKCWVTVLHVVRLIMISGFTQLSAAANMYLNHTQHLLEQIKQPQHIHFSFTGHFRVYMHDRNNSKHTQKVLKSILCIIQIENNIPRRTGLLPKPQMLKEKLNLKHFNTITLKPDVMITTWT